MDARDHRNYNAINRPAAASYAGDDLHRDTFPPWQDIPRTYNNPRCGTRRSGNVSLILTKARHNDHTTIQRSHHPWPSGKTHLLDPHQWSLPRGYRWLAT